MEAVAVAVEGGEDRDMVGRLCSGQREAAVCDASVAVTPSARGLLLSSQWGGV